MTQSIMDMMDGPAQGLLKLSPFSKNTEYSDPIREAGESDKPSIATLAEYCKQDEQVTSRLRHWTQTTSISDLRAFTIKLHAITSTGKFYSKVYKNFLSPSKLVAKQTTTYLLIRQGFTDVRVVGVWKDVQS